MSVASVAELVKLNEGLRLRAYDDSNALPIRPGILIKGHPTIGYGRALDLNGISAAEADILLANDLAAVAHQASGSIGDDVWPSFGEVRQAAFIDMAFTMGLAHFASFHQMIGCARQCDWRGVYDQALKSAWAARAPDRAQRDAAMLLSGAWPA
jgi:lysozyme